MIARMFTSAAAAIALSATPVMAQDSTSSRLPAPIEAESEQLEGGGIIIAILAAAAVITGIIIAAGGSDENLPTSP